MVNCRNMTGFPAIVIVHADSGVQFYALTQTLVTVGAALDNNIVVRYLGVDRHHGAVEAMDDGSFRYTDYGTTHLSWVLCRSVDRFVLQHGDVVSLGSFPKQVQLLFLQHEDAPAVESLHKSFQSPVKWPSK